LNTLTNKDEQILLNSIRNIKNFPIPGIDFKDISTLLNNPLAFKTLMDHLVDRYKNYQLEYIAGLDARGFIFGGVLADRLNIGFVPIRKKGKLPYKTFSEKYTLEYGFDEIEVHIDAFGSNGISNKTGNPSNVLIIDDLIATGGTAAAAVNLVKKSGANCVETCFILEVTSLLGKNKINTPIYSVLQV